MPQVFKRSGSPNYYARFQVQGRDYVLSTGTSKRSEAIAAMRRLLAEKKGTLSVSETFDALLRELGRQEKAAETPSRRRELLALRQDMGRQILGTQSEKLALTDAWQAWLDNPKKRNPDPVTIQNYRSEWDRFLGWAKKQEIRFLHEITAARAEEYASDLWKSGVSAGTYNQHVNFLKRLCRVLKNSAGLVDNPWDEIPAFPRESAGRRMLSSAELETVCKTATRNLRFMIGIGLYTGMRLGDVVTMRWDAIQDEAGVIEILPRKTKRLNKKVRLPIHPVLNALLAELRAKTGKGDFLFPKERTDYLKDRGIVTRKIQGIFKACGIATTEAPENEHRRRAIVRVGFHSLRHSFVSLCAANKVPQVAIMELVGHGSPAMTALYSHAGDDQKTSAIAALPAFVFDESGEEPGKEEGPLNDRKHQKHSP